MRPILSHDDDVAFTEILLMHGWNDVILAHRFPRLTNDALFVWASMLAKVAVYVPVAQSYHETLVGLCIAYDLLPLQGVAVPVASPCGKGWAQMMRV